MALSQPLRQKIVAVATAREECGIPYAMGGAIAYGFAAEPRGTLDIDVNIFLAATDPAATLECLARIGVHVEAGTAATIEREGQVRLDMDDTFVDLFFAYAPFHQSCASRAFASPFEGITMPVITAEDLVVFKALFNRPKDWLDIEQILLTRGTTFDSAYALGWLDAMLGPEDSCRRRLAGILDQSHT